MKKITILSMMLFCSINFIVAQTVITVDNTVDANAQYSDLQDAIDNAGNNDVLYVHASEINYGDVTINKPLTLIGFAHSSEDKNTLVNDIELVDGASGTRISGFRITDDLFVNSSVTLTNLIYENNYIEDAISFFGEGASDVLIRGSVVEYIGSFSTASSSAGCNFTNTLITNNIVNDAIVTLFPESVTIRNNVFLRGNVDNYEADNFDQVVQNCVFLVRSNSELDINVDGVFYDNCLAYNVFETGTVAPLNGTDNIINQAPLFVSAPEFASVDFAFNAQLDDYNLQVGSPAIGTGAGGVDIGLYDNINFVFNNFGLTPGVPIVNITAITDQVAPGAMVEVTIESSSN